MEIKLKIKWLTVNMMNLNLLLETINVCHFLITALLHLFYGGRQLGDGIASAFSLASQLRFLLILKKNTPSHVRTYWKHRL